eukprot:GHVS01053450.1.p1 GENE.GHVS01053450.1~~GHVS01053450.1.p1  ORF type:complete len:174 (+),score=72.92 GHVS01053450.1:230-751(+)
MMSFKTSKWLCLLLLCPLPLVRCSHRLLLPLALPSSSSSSFRLSPQSLSLLQSLQPTFHQFNATTSTPPPAPLPMFSSIHSDASSTTSALPPYLLLLSPRNAHTRRPSSSSSSGITTSPSRSSSSSSFVRAGGVLSPFSDVLGVSLAPPPSTNYQQFAAARRAAAAVAAAGRL